MNIHIISVGKLPKEFAAIASEYEKMIRWQLKSTEISYNQKLPPAQIKQFEAKLITKYLPLKSYKIILDVEGKQLSSEDFARLFQSGEFTNNRDLDFIIGGAFGLDESIKAMAGTRISFSKMTFSHKIAKIILLEQIYRAQTIIENHPYHK
jgi:23S rRNA (pseudouridine1915-N3)-methyltransferase